MGESEPRYEPWTILKLRTEVFEGSNQVGLEPKATTTLGLCALGISKISEPTS